jgi:SAM-dependent MidA family methyltransferase
MTRKAEEAIRAAISAEGPLTFARFMELALYGPGGYYENPPIGPSGDFVTSPHVHEVFATLLARALTELHEALGSPDPYRILEVGAGDGTLARRLLQHLDLPGVDYTAAERSPGAREALGRIGGIRVTGELDPTGSHVVLAHELLDNLPFHVLRGEREVRITTEGDNFVETLVDPGEELAPYVRPERAAETVVPTGALAFIEELAAGHAGAPAGGPLHGYRDQRVVEDVLASPGDNDITAGVDLSLVAAHAQSRGLNAFPTVMQRDALLALGFEGWLRKELARQQQQLEDRDGIAAVRTWSSRSRASLLIDPGALGRMRWLLLATEGLPEPPWLTVALAAEPRSQS